MNNPPDIVSHVRAAALESELVLAVSSVNEDDGIAFALGQVILRAIRPDEIRVLKANGNWAEDWSSIRVDERFDPQRIRSSNFYGQIVLGRFESPVRAAEDTQLPSGIANSTVADCTIGHNSLVRDVHLLAKYVVGPEALLLNCGSVTCVGRTSFGNGIELPVGLETGGRDVAVFAEIDVAVAADVARSRSKKELLANYAQVVANYVTRATCHRGIIGEGATLRDTAQVRNTYVGPFAHLDGATRIADSTLLSSRDEPVRIQSGAYVNKSIVQWGSDVTTMAIVDRSVLTEHSHVERHGKVTDSIIGPNSGVAEGEATACLLGPFVGFHHQALLIAVLWPEGKGNVGYGANVGSNHTSKAPDQEFWPGEGAFLGLGVNVKFPSDFSRAPYTIIASGVSTLPQKVTFPFSLINSPSVSYPGVSPAYNEIIPAWLLMDNMYTLKRNEGKYKARNKARRTQFTFDVFRPDTVELMRDASRRLMSIRNIKQLYTDSDIDGLGKNYLPETYREPAIAAYRFYVKYYALLGMKDTLQRLLAAGNRQAVDQMLDTPSPMQPWEHQRAILREELGITEVVAGLSQLPGMLEKVARDVEQSKAKDDRRGARIIDDYADVHSPAAEDKFVKQTWQETRELIHSVEQLIASLQSR